MSTPDDRARGASQRPARATTRWRVELREPLGPVVFAADVFDADGGEIRARWLENQLYLNRRYNPRVLRWPVTVIAYDIDNEVLWEEVG